MMLSTRALASRIGAFADEWGDVDLEALSADEFLALTADLRSVRRALDHAQTQVAGELAHRSAPHLGGDGIARRAGHSRPGLFLAELWQLTSAEGVRLCEVGEATRAATAVDGSALPARYPAIGEALATGAVSADAAAVIVHELEQAAPRCSADARLAGERALVDHAPGLTVKQVAGIARHVRDHLDQDGAEPRDVIRRHRRSLTMVQLPDGMTRFVWTMPPETAGLVRAGIDHLVGEQLRQKRDRDQQGLATDGMVDLDDRTMPQRRADAAEELFRAAIASFGTAPTVPLVTMVIRMTLDQLLDGCGAAQIDGIEAGISATTARLLAAEANIIPAVLGGEGEVLDLGRSRRLFSTAQRQALAEHFGGCVFPSCAHPPSYTEAHHLHWWSNGGPTDLANGIPLCSFHHHRIHDDGWEIVMRERVPYFVPPPWIDTDRVPRRGGKVVIPMGTG
ncbi:HNH endonuclease signature motif containing protein [Lacisediminihabitans changchengi]|uniref:DUF222 domain-containing protein n=1 Tax=Lacisediminihabitans changchengi TaxID=2787634 RepID=A0A934SQ85_9MICO|nr:HNH endonuclease signature motif containing protein [Lacisediminihabitans changchengi]MBK4346184.1 DUF222 domain-containing protein [Lacisediminihabitans changchengi]